MEYYVYVYLDPRQESEFKYGEFEFEHMPYYIGKGKDERIFDKKSNAVRYYESKIIEEGYSPIKIFYKKSLDELSAYKLETKMIKTIKRRREGGPLLNVIKSQVETYKKSRKARKKKQNIRKNKINEAQSEMIDFLNSLQ